MDIGLREKVYVSIVHPLTPRQQLIGSRAPRNHEDNYTLRELEIEMHGFTVGVCSLAL